MGMRIGFADAGKVAVDVYAQITDGLSRFVRLEELVYAAADIVPGLAPSRAEMAGEARLPLAQQAGLGIAQMHLVAHVLNDAACGAHLLQAMRLPGAESLQQLPRFEQGGELHLPAASVERVGKVCYVTLNRPEVLNAEDEPSLADLEIAVDLALLDPRSEAVVLRGSRIATPKYAGRRVFCSGINLTQLHDGKISPLWYLQRELGVLHKIYRGLAAAAPEVEVFAATREKPWIAQLDGFAIGGGCQYLLVMDAVVAAADAYLTLPARKEGIIPGAANLRLPRFVGDRLARQMILADRRVDCASDIGRLLCDRVAAAVDVEAAVQDLADQMLDSGIVSYAANRRALRLAQEPLEMFRRYMALYAREQAYCHHSPALVANLRRNWRA